MRHDETWKLETEPRQNIQVTRLSQDRYMRNHFSRQVTWLQTPWLVFGELSGKNEWHLSGNQRPIARSFAPRCELLACGWQRRRRLADWRVWCRWLECYGHRLPVSSSFCLRCSRRQRQPSGAVLVNGQLRRNPVLTSHIVKYWVTELKCQIN